MKNTPKAGILYLAVCSFLWSTGGLFIKLIDWNPMVIGGLRSLIAAAVIWLALCHSKTPKPIVNRQTLATAVLLGGTCCLFVIANKLTTAANAIVLQSANPIFVLLFFALVRHQRITKRDYTVVGVVLLGVILFFLDELSPGSMLGNLLALASAVLIAGAFIFASESKTLHETMSGVLLGHLFNGLFGLCFVPFFPPVFTGQSVLCILFLGVFQLGIPYVLFSYGANLCPPLAISLLGMLEPIFSPLWVALFLHELPGPLALTGGVLVMVTLALWCVANARQGRNA